MPHLKEPNMRSKPCLNLSDVKTMLAACEAEAAKNKWAVALGKARTSAMTRRPSKVFEDRIKERPAFVTFPAGLPIQGAVPVMHQNECVGAIGVSGVQSHEDEQIALAGVSALG
jgi:glc operon protein GlcG